MLLVAIPTPYFIIGVIVILITIFLVFLFIRENKKRKLFITQVVYQLMKEKMEDVQYIEKNKIYDISFKYNGRYFYVKLHEGGSKKGFIMTNPTTIHEQTYSSNYGPSKDSEYASKLTPFLVEPLNGLKIILIKNNMLRITKYINENEIEEVRYNEPAFNVYIVQEKDLTNFINLIKKKKK